MDGMKEMNLIMMLLNVLMVLIIGVTLAILPYITRRSLLFGIRVPEAAHGLPEVRRMKRLFSAAMLAVMAISLGLAIAQYYYRPEYTLLATLYLPLLMLPFQFLVYLPLWRQAARLKNQSGWIIPAVGTAETRSARSRERFGGLPWLWYIIGAGSSILAALLSLLAYPSMPDTIVTHWNGAMEADAWAVKSIGHILVLPIISLVMTAFMLGCNFIIYRMKLQVSQDNPALSYAQHRVYRRLMSHVLGFITLCICAMFLVLQPMMLNLWIPSGLFMVGFMLVPTTLMIVPPVWVSVKAGQAGNKLNPAITDADVAAAGYPQPDGTLTRKSFSDDRYWKLGMFYFNREDPSIFVEDRFGNNGGLNYARPGAIVLAGFLLLLILATYIGSTILFVHLIW